MSAPRILLVYGSSYGQTAKIAARMAAILRQEGNDVTLLKGDEAALPQSVAPFDGVMIGGSIILGHHQRYLEQFARRARAELRRLPTAFFSVSGSAGSPLPNIRAEADRCVEQFLARTEWRPDMTATIGGAIAYTRYNPLLRWMMRRISRKSGGSTDSSMDHEYTDWSVVDRFAADFAALVADSVSTPTEPVGAIVG